MIRVPETRAMRRAGHALAAYRGGVGVLGRSRASEALAGHLEAALAENAKLRAEVLAMRSAMEAADADHAVTVRLAVDVLMGRG